MEHRRDLAETLLSGLTDHERKQTATSIRRTTDAKLQHLRSTDYDVTTQVDNRARQSAD